jgi:hypothetical protein
MTPGPVGAPELPLLSQWQVQRDYQGSGRSIRVQFYCGTRCLSYADVLTALRTEASFRELLQNEMRIAPFNAFRWETPPLHPATVRQPFECLLHDSPGLDVPADPTEFQDRFRVDAEVVGFNNLGGDAVLIVPCPVSPSANYSHIAAFHRTAPEAQQHAFWTAVAQAVCERIGPRPLWLSTAGGGVDWLHMRLDTRPKYYRHQPWRTWMPE